MATKTLRIVRRNKLNQSFGVGADVSETNPARRGRTLKMSAAATRAIATYPAAERAALATAAAACAAEDDRAIRGMVWDCHVAIASGDVNVLRPGVADETAVAAWRKVRGLKPAAVTAPAPRA